MSKSIKLKNDIYISREGIGKTLWSGNFRIGETKTITGLSNYRVLEFWYARGNDYGNVIQTCSYGYKHTSPSILYADNYYRRRTANIYWSGDDVEFRSVLIEDGTSITISKETNNYDSIVKIVGYN